MKKNILLVAIVATALLSSCSAKKQEEIKKFELSPQMLESLTFDDVKQTQLAGDLQLTGKVIPDENNLVNIYPMVGGKVTMVDVEIGELVSTSKPLVIINSGEAREFEKEYINAKDEYELANKNYEIQSDLNKTKFTSERELAYAKKDLQLAKAEVSRLEEVYKVYNLTSGGNYVIKSPVAGFVVEKKIGPNMQLRPDMNDYILSVARLEEVFIALNIYENDISKVKLGQRVRIKSFSYPDSTIYGTVDKIANMIDPITRTIQARILIKNPKFMLKPEMNCVGTISYNEGKEMLAVDKNAVIFDKSKAFVLIYVSKTKIITRQIEIFRETEDLVYISSGLKAGDKLITNNQLFIYDALND
jgi:membrane fusion protein, heavy metal efflux system